MAADALIFDLDGTVWHSAAWFAGGFAAGQDVAAIEADLVAGGNVVGLLDRFGMTRQRLLREAAARGGPPPLFEGVRDALAALAARGTPLGVATSLPGSLAEPMLTLAGIAGLFQTIVHAGSCRTSKPHPRSLLMAADALGIKPGPRVFYVGDRAVDAEAARRAGMGSAWMSHGYERPGLDYAGRVVAAPALLDL